MSKYVIDDSTLASIAEAIRGKTGGTDPIAVTDMAAQIESITGGGSSDEVILEEQSIVFIKSDIDVSVSLHAQNPIVIGETYNILWDGTEYECTASEMEDIAFMGNLLPVGGEDNGVPFAMVCVIDEGVIWLDIVSVYETTASTHTVAIYKESSGGGSVEGVVYVTFKNWDGTKLVTKPVFKYDHCTDPVDIEQITEPTRESTNTQTFDFNGWSLTAGGAADDSALLNVAEDRTVYAAYTASTRYYTVRFFDGDTLLHTVYAEYGSTAEYTANKEGVGFGGWQPSNENITQDTDCYAQWVEKIAFADASWEKISEICESGDASKHFAVGDTKEISNGTYTFTARIIGIEYDDKADGSGKAGITVALTPSHHQWSYGYITSSAICWYLYGTSCNLRQKLQGTFYTDYLPTEVTSVIKTVTKETRFEGGSYVDKSADTIFVPDLAEIFGNYSGREGVAAYPGFANQEDRVQYDSTGKAVEWLVRFGSGGWACTVNTAGSSYWSNASYKTAYHTMPCFCI